MNFLKRVLSSCLFFSVSALANQDIYVGSFYDILPAKSASYSKVVMNNGSSTAFVKILVKEVFFDSNGKIVEDTAIFDDKNDEKLSERLIVSPNRLVIPANGSRSSRVMFMGKRDVERYFRVTYLPVIPNKDNGFDNEEYKDDTKLSAGVNVLIGYGTLVYVAPSNVRYKTDIVALKEKFEVINNGNASIKLEFLTTCKADRKCDAPTTTILKPGMRMTYSKNDISSIHFDLVEGDAVTRKKYRF